MTVELIAVGTELLLGQIANTDARDLSRRLSELGLTVYHHSVVGDNAERLREALRCAAARSDIIITTGGLGPTYDDMTKQTAAACFGKSLVLHEPTWKKIQAYFAKIGREVTPNNKNQAMLPEDCTLLENDWGTAPGCAFTADGKHIILLPGPPRECLSMFDHCVRPYLEKLSGDCIVSRYVRIFGMGESAVEDLLHGFIESAENPTVAPYAKEGEVLLRVTAKANTREAAFALTEPAVRRLYDMLPDVIYGVDVDSLEQRVIDLLGERGQTLALAESCTGGLISKRLTDIPGASKVYLGAVCAYSPSAKETLLGVDAERIRKHGLVSGPVALSMAEGARHVFGADLALGVTGLAGPDLDGVPGGTVYMALARKDALTEVRRFDLGQDRTRVRHMASGWGLDLIRRALLLLEA